MGMDTSIRVTCGMTRGRKGLGPQGAIGDTDSRSTPGPDPAAEDIRIVTPPITEVGFDQFAQKVDYNREQWSIQCIASTHQIVHYR